MLDPRMLGSISLTTVLDDDDFFEPVVYTVAR